MRETQMDNVIANTLAALEQNGIRTACMGSTIAARRKVLELIPKGSTVGVGDSVTVRQLDVLDALQESGRVLVNLFSKEISLAVTKGEIGRSRRRVICDLTLACEFFLTGTNAVTQDGKLVNIDGSGNRVAGMIFGPRKVIVVIGRNKIVKNTDEALYRIRNIIAPQHAKTKKMRTPCARIGKCTDCNSPDRICNVTTIIEKALPHTEISLLLVNEDLGLGWSEDWPKGRITRIRSHYEECTWLKRNLGSANESQTCSQL